MTTARVSTKGQVVIPKAVRTQLGIREGDQVEFTVHGGHAHLEKREAGDALDAFLGGPKTTWVDGELDALLDEQYA